MHAGRPKKALGLALGAFLLLPISVAADDRGGLYHRFDGDLASSLSLGGGVAFGGSEPVGHFAADLQLRYLGLAGPLLAFGWGPEPARFAIAGVAVRPLFPAIFLLNWSTGHEWFDLAFQSLSFELGAALAPLDAELGVGLALGGSLSLPLLSPSYGGWSLALKMGGRYVHARSNARFGPQEDVEVGTLYLALEVEKLWATGWTRKSEGPRYRLP